MRNARAVLLAAPGVSLGTAGLFHPEHLSYATAHAWWILHLVGLFAFPLVGVALMALFAGRRDPVALLAVLAAFFYATAYTALDVVNGLAAGYVTDRLGPGVPRPPEVTYLFRIGTPIGVLGSVALIVAAVVVVLDALRQVGAQAVPAVLLLPGAYLVHAHHIFAPEGVVGMLLIGFSTGWLGYVADAAQNSRSDGSSIPRSAS